MFLKNWRENTAQKIVERACGFWYNISDKKFETERSMGTLFKNCAYKYKAEKFTVSVFTF